MSGSVLAVPRRLRGLGYRPFPGPAQSHHRFRKRDVPSAARRGTARRGPRLPARLCGRSGSRRVGNQLAQRIARHQRHQPDQSGPDRTWHVRHQNQRSQRHRMDGDINKIRGRHRDLCGNRQGLLRKEAAQTNRGHVRPMGHRHRGGRLRRFLRMERRHSADRLGRIRSMAVRDRFRRCVDRRPNG